MRLLLLVFMSTGMTTTGVADIGNDITEPDASSPKLPHCLMPYRNALRRALGIVAVNPKLHRAPGCLSVIPDNTGVRTI